MEQQHRFDPAGHIIVNGDSKARDMIGAEIRLRGCTLGHTGLQQKAEIEICRDGRLGV